MLDHINLELKLPKPDYKERLPKLQGRLYELEQAVFQARVPVALVFEGWAAAGKGTTINLLAERMDARGFHVVPINPPRTAEMAFPWMRRFWLRLPGRGEIVCFDTSWYRRVLIERVAKEVPKRVWRNAYQDILDFEAQLAADGMVILKFWLHISEKEQARRFKKLRASKITAWQVSDEDAAQHKKYKEYRFAVEEMLGRTDTAHAPWIVVEATDRRYTQIKVLESIVHALEQRLGPTLAALSAATQPERMPVPERVTPVGAVAALDASVSDNSNAQEDSHA